MAQGKREPMVQMAVEHYQGYRWVQAPIAALALWLLTSPYCLGYRSRAMTWSDTLSGLCVLALAVVARNPRRGLVSWMISLVGLWLLLAPLVFWAPDAVAYANDTLVGALLIVFAFLVPMGMKMEGPALPPGWSYNPSSWSQRAPIIALGFIGFLIARYMAAFQLGYISPVWDPFFGSSSEQVLTSRVSRAFPVSDAGLGAATYMLEVLMGFMGDGRRWRTMPWMVSGFAFVVVPLGLVSIVLVILQPLAVGAWCTPCLATAIAMLFMIPLSLDEVVAMIQVLVRERREGRSAWRAFWLGTHGRPEGEVVERPDTFAPRDMVRGVTGPWGLWLSAAVGVWLMFAPAALGVAIDQPAADSDHLVGALIVVIAVIAMAEVARPLRYLNVVLGAWLFVAPWFLRGTNGWSLWSTMFSGAAVILLSLPRPAQREHYGSFDRALQRV